MLDSQISVSISNSDELNLERKTLKAMLDKMYTERTRGAKVRSRMNCVENVSNEYLFYKNMEKQHYVHNCIDSLKDVCNNITYDTDEKILEHARSFYCDLYKSNSVPDDDMQHYLNDLSIPNTLSNDGKAKCEGIVTLKECQDTVDILKPKKRPGLDGLPSEFYRCFWNEIKHVLVDMYNESFIRCKLPSSLRCAVMSLIFKMGDREMIKNYRTISLTNIDY